MRALYDGRIRTRPGRGGARRSLRCLRLHHRRGVRRRDAVGPLDAGREAGLAQRGGVPQRLRAEQLHAGRQCRQHSRRRRDAPRRLSRRGRGADRPRPPARADGHRRREPLQGLRRSAGGAVDDRSGRRRGGRPRRRDGPQDDGPVEGEPAGARGHRRGAVRGRGAAHAVDLDAVPHPAGEPPRGAPGKAVMDRPVVALGLYLAFLSAVSVGGFITVIPELNRFVVDVRRWMTDETFVTLFALAQAAPGPNMIVVTLVGWEVAGVAGAVAATAATCLPTLVLASVAAKLWSRYNRASWY